MSSIFKGSVQYNETNQKASTTQLKTTLQIEEPILENLVIKMPAQHKISAVPLEFQYLPVELLSKQFTKFNNPHKYRIHYLGPRPINSFILHKKYGSIEFQPSKVQPDCARDFDKYCVNLRRIVQSTFINEGLRTNSHYKNAIFYRAFQGMNPTLNLKDEIIFNSAFQSGNLDCVIKPRNNVFDLFLRIDSNTRGHTQWYYFSVKNGKKGQKIKLNICNITKGKTLYEQGMKPYIFSRKKKEKSKFTYTWQQGGQNINFQQKPLRYQILYQSIKVSCLYELSFEYQFQYQGDQVFFAYSIPFTYSQLLHRINNFPSVLVKKQILGTSFTGIDIPLLHITNFHSESYRKEKKKNVLITGRIHPGQSNSSHMLNGFIEFLISNTQQANQLRNRVNFFIIPMANPDGVIMGNSRTSAAGKDLNREFKSHKYQLYPEVHLIKNFALKIKRKHGLYMSLDFHGHSRKKNTFFYGPPYVLSDAQYYKCRAFPRLVQKINSSFRYYGCSFGISEEKKTTGRGVLFYQLKIPYTYTIESSIGLYYNFEEKITAEFEQKAWAKMGSDIGIGLSQFIVMEEEYEAAIKEKLLARQRAKQLRGKDPNRISKEGDQNDLNEDGLQLKNSDSQKDIKVNMFEGLLDQIKQQCTKQSNFDQDISSDDHDANQDLQDIKLNEFNNLILQSAQKEQGLSKSKTFFEDTVFEQYPSSQLENKPHRQSLGQLKSNRKDTRQPVHHSLNQKFRNRQIGIKTQNIKSKYRSSDKQIESISPVKTETIKRVHKNFVIANKEKYSIATKNFLISQNNRYEVIELPKNIQNIRKQLTKGRILINNLFQSKIKTSKEGSQNESTNWHQPFIEERNLGTSQFVRSPIKDKNEIFLMKQQNGGSPQKRSSTSHLNRKSIQSKTPSRLSPKRKRTIDIAQQYQTFNNFEVDNLAMTIKSFKGF